MDLVLAEHQVLAGRGSGQERDREGGGEVMEKWKECGAHPARRHELVLKSTR